MSTPSSGASKTSFDRFLIEHIGNAELSEQNYKKLSRKIAAEEDLSAIKSISLDLFGMLWNQQLLVYQQQQQLQGLVAQLQNKKSMHIHSASRSSVSMSSRSMETGYLSQGAPMAPVESVSTLMEEASRLISNLGPSASEVFQPGFLSGLGNIGGGLGLQPLSFTSHRGSLDASPSIGVYSNLSEMVPQRAALRRTLGTSEMDGGEVLKVCQFEVIQELGHGNYGKVLLAIDEKGKAVAIKSLPRARPVARNRMLAARSGVSTDFGTMDSRGASHETSFASGVSVRGKPLSGSGGAAAVRSVVEQEIEIMKQLRHPNVVELYEVIEDPDEDQTHLVMQYVENGPIASIDSCTGTCRSIALDEALHFMCQVSAGLDHLHKRGILHRDIKPENILIGKGKTAYVADFGVSGIVSELTQRDAGCQAGTWPFFSPELIRDNTAVVRYGVACDIWAFGVTLFAVVYGRLPFFGPDRLSTTKKILSGIIAFPPTSRAGAEIPSEFHDLIREILTEVPEERLSLRAFRHHPFVVSNRLKTSSPLGYSVFDDYPAGGGFAVTKTGSWLSANEGAPSPPMQPPHSLHILGQSTAPMHSMEAHGAPLSISSGEAPSFVVTVNSTGESYRPSFDREVTSSEDQFSFHESSDEGPGKGMLLTPPFNPDRRPTAEGIPDPSAGSISSNPEAADSNSTRQPSMELPSVCIVGASMERKESIASGTEVVSEEGSPQADGGSVSAPSAPTAEKPHTPPQMQITVANTNSPTHLDPSSARLIDLSGLKEQFGLKDSDGVDVTLSRTEVIPSPGVTPTVLSLQAQNSIQPPRFSLEVHGESGSGTTNLQPGNRRQSLSPSPATSASATAAEWKFTKVNSNHSTASGGSSNGGHVRPMAGTAEPPAGGEPGTGEFTQTAPVRVASVRFLSKQRVASFTARSVASKFVTRIRHRMKVRTTSFGGTGSNAQSREDLHDEAGFSNLEGGGGSRYLRDGVGKKSSSVSVVSTGSTVASTRNGMTNATATSTSGGGTGHNPSLASPTPSTGLPSTVSRDERGSQPSPGAEGSATGASGATGGASGNGATGGWGSNLLDSFGSGAGAASTRSKEVVSRYVSGIREKVENAWKNSSGGV